MHRPLNEGAVLLNLDDGSYFEIDAVGLVIWEALDGRCVDEIVDVVRQAFEDAPESVAEDARVFVQALVASELVVPVEDV